MLRVKQVGIKYHFLSLWYDSTWDWTPVSQTIGKHKLADHSWGQPEGSLLIGTISRCRGGCNSFPWITLLTLDPYLIILSVKQGGIRYHFFKSFVWLDLGLNPGLRNHWWILYPLGQWTNTYINIYKRMHIHIYIFFFFHIHTHR